MSADESYSRGNGQQKHVTIADKLKNVYDSVFAVNYTGAVQHTVIGSLEFTAYTKEIMMRTAGLFSKYTNTKLD